MLKYLGWILDDDTTSTELPGELYELIYDQAPY